ncbi:endothelin-converting enzyme homolog isoform X2 [Mytilus galloprovincialis]|uniref:endothelin-converting enzyme homolog isoform X2 n=1 Tax=Mytilus galloprovincialis TaxID=29158 RepID=UPI003F7BB493
MTSNGKGGEATYLVNEDELAKSNVEEKLRNRTISEGYKYRSLDESVSSSEGSAEGDTVKRKPDALWSQRYNRLACLLAIAVFVIAFLVGIVIYQHVTKDDTDICTKPECVHSSSYITAQMNLSADPCQDFYQFICGNWENTVTIPDSRPKYNIFSVVSDQNKVYIRKILKSNSTVIKGQHSETVQKMKTYYKMCLDTSKINELGSEPLTQFIKMIGGWTVTDTGFDESKWKLEDVLAKINIYNFAPLFDVGITIDDKNSSQYVLSFTQPGLTLKTEEEYNTTYSSYKDLRNAMLDFGATLGQYLGGDYNETRQKMEDIYNFEKQLSEIFVPKEILRQPDLIYHKMTLKELQGIMGNWIDLSEYLQNFLGYKLSEDTDVIVYTPDYLTKLAPIMQKTLSNKQLLANYMVWSAVQYFMGFLPLKYSKAALILDKVESGVKELDPLTQRCVDKTNTVFGFATGAMYVEQHFSESSRSEVQDILDRVLKAFYDNMPEVDWMDKETREKAQAKLKYITPMIGYPDWILNVTELDKYYENVTISTDRFFDSYLSHRKVEVDRVLRKLNTVPDRSEWDMMPYAVNAYYTPQLNKIVFPAGILQRPFYDPEFPLSYSFGSIGAVMGHEMTHGFDDQGRHFDKYGNLENWWTNRSSQGFIQKSQCMIDQYSQFKYQGYNIKGETTIGENIADNGGVKSGYTAFSSWKPEDIKKFPGLNLTPEQLYFIGFGQIWCSYYTPAHARTSILTDVHSPAPIRPNGIAVNSPAFSKAFNCPKGSPMNPDHRCEIW